MRTSGYTGTVTLTKALIINGLLDGKVLRDYIDATHPTNRDAPTC